MELLLNLIWMALGLVALLGFLRGRRVSSQISRVPYRKSLFALACAVLLLFPVVSASDDLHPTQAVMEESSKRLQIAVAPLQLQRVILPAFMLAATLVIWMMGALIVLRPLQILALKMRHLGGVVVPSAGRAPPAYCWN
jgi:hypothetical protein